MTGRVLRAKSGLWTPSRLQAISFALALAMRSSSFGYWVRQHKGTCSPTAGLITIRILTRMNRFEAPEIEPCPASGNQESCPVDCPHFNLSVFPSFCPTSDIVFVVRQRFVWRTIGLSGVSEPVCSALSSLPRPEYTWCGYTGSHHQSCGTRCTFMPTDPIFSSLANIGGKNSEIAA